MPDNVNLTAEEGDYLGWYDSAPDQQGVIGYTEAGTQGVCVVSGTATPADGQEVSGNMAGNRRYAINVCFGK